MPDVFASLPCRDADIAELAVGDFATLTAKSERIAYADDGVIGAGSFMLSSAFPFEQQGVQAGHVVVLEGYMTTTTQNVARLVPMPGGVTNDLLPVTSVSGSTVTLNRIGYPTGQGAFPGGIAGCSAIKFYCPSLLAQIITATSDVKRRLSLSVSSVLINTTDLRIITILVVLRGLYFAQYRQTNDDVFRAKMNDLDAQIKDQYMSLEQVYADQTPMGRRPLLGTMVDDPTWRVPLDY